MLGEDYEVKNFGVSATTVLKKGDFPYVTSDLFVSSKDFNPDIVIIMLGTNDSKDKNWSNYKDDFVVDYSELINAYRNLPSSPKVLIGTSPSVIGEGNFDITEAVVSGQIVPLQKQVAFDIGCFVVDINNLTKDKSHLYVDRVHLTDGGYLQIANAFYNSIINYDLLTSTETMMSDEISNESNIESGTNETESGNSNIKNIENNRGLDPLLLILILILGLVIISSLFFIKSGRSQTN